MASCTPRSCTARGNPNASADQGIAGTRIPTHTAAGTRPDTTDFSADFVASRGGSAAAVMASAWRGKVRARSAYAAVAELAG